MLLAGRAALVTGGANGIGRATVERFLAEGARVAVVDREPAPDFGPAATSFRFDLSQTDRLPALVAEVEAAVGPLDVLVNNAGIWEPTPVATLALEVWRKMLAVDLDAPVFLAATVGSGMARRGYGRIVNVTSVHGQFGQRQALVYDVAKAGLNQATRTLAVELAEANVLVNAVAPGFVSTRLSVHDGKHDRESDWFQNVYVAQAKLPLRRYAEPAEIAAQIAWLASDQNSYLTGQVVTVDGGLTVTF